MSDQVRIGNVIQLSLDGLLTTASLRVEKAQIYDELVLQAVMTTADGFSFVNSYGPGHKREKYVLAVATQIGCAVKCREICRVPRYQRDFTAQELSDQVLLLQSLAQKLYLHPKLKIAMVKEGEPLLNRNLPEILETLG